MKKVFFEEITSTNDYAKEHFAETEDKTIICADNQTNGHGRLGRKWISTNAKGLNLYTSLVLKPPKECAYNNFTQYVSVVLCKVLEEYGVNANIKWPNDILVNGLKICGILAERTSQMNGFVIGIGVNLNLTKEETESIDKPAISLNLILNKKIDRDEFLEKFCTEFEKNYDKFLTQGFEYIRENYLKRINFLGREISVSLNKDNKIKGIAKDINKDGELVLVLPDQKEQVIISGEIN